MEVTNLHLTLAPGDNRVSFFTDAPAAPQQAAFEVVNFDLADSPRPEQ